MDEQDWQALYWRAEFDREEAVRDAEEVRAVARQFFEASVQTFQGTAVQRASYATAILSRWPWLRPDEDMNK